LLASEDIQERKSMQLQRVLIAYTTNSGSTAEVAQAVGMELNKNGVQVDVRRLEEVTEIEPYTARWLSRRSQAIISTGL